MGLPKGSVKDPATGKWIFPEGYQPAAERERAKKKTPSSQATGAEKRFDRERLAARQNYSFRLYAIYPSGKHWLADTLEPSLEYVANNYGGGKYEVWKYATDTGEYIGDAVPYNVDPTVWPPKLRDPQSSARPYQSPMPYGGGGFFGAPAGGYGPQGPYGPPAGGYGPQGPYGPPGGKDDDLEDELDDLEKENAQLKAQLIGLTRERDEAKATMERERAEALRKEDRAQFEATLKALEAKFTGTKDPLDQMLAFKRVEAELNGGVVGKGGSPTDMLTLAMGLMNTIMTAAKSLPQEGGSSSGLETVMKMADRYLPMITKLTEQKAGGQVVDEAAAGKAKPDTPAPAPVRATPPEPAPAPGPELKAFEAILEVLPNYQNAGDADAFGDWIAGQDGDGWKEAHEIIMAENPADFLPAVLKARPTSSDTDEKKKWIVLAMSAAQKKLLDKKASLVKG